MSSNPTTNETSNIATLPSTPKAQTAKEIIAANIKLLIEQLETRTEWHRVYAWRNLSRFAKTLQKGQLVTLEGTLKYRDVEDDVEGTPFKHRIAEIHATSLKRLSKIEAADDPTDAAGDE